MTYFFISILLNILYFIFHIISDNTLILSSNHSRSHRLYGLSFNRLPYQKSELDSSSFNTYNLWVEIVEIDQFNLGRQDMEEKNLHLVELDMEESMAESVASIRGWLCDVLIARGKFIEATEEGLRNRQCTLVCHRQITNKQRKEFLDWRNVKLR